MSIESSPRGSCVADWINTLVTLLGLSSYVAGSWTRSLVKPGLEEYHQLIQTIPQVLVDAGISWGTNLGGVLVLIGLSNFANELSDRRAEVPLDWVNVLLSATFVLGELGEILEAAPTCQTTGIGCGDWIDLTIFAIPAALAGLRFATRRLGLRQLPDQIW